MYTCFEIYSELLLFTDQDKVTDHRRRDPDHYLVYQDVEAGNYVSQPYATVKGYYEISY